MWRGWWRRHHARRGLGDAAAEVRVPRRSPASPSTEPLKVGSLLPETGSLAFLGPPEFAGVDLAVVEINENGGVLGQQVTHVRGDSGDDTTDIANQTVDRQLGQRHPEAIVGAAASGVTKLVIGKVTSAGVVQFSPANTSDEFTCWQDKGLYFRTAPPDALQAQALANVIAGDGSQRVPASSYWRPGAARASPTTSSRACSPPASRRTRSRRSSTTRTLRRSTSKTRSPSSTPTASP